MALPSSNAQTAHESLHNDANTMDSLRIFSQDIGGRSVAVSAVMVGDNPWFRGTDVASALGYARPRNAVRDNVDERDRETLQNLMGTADVPTLEYHVATQVFISESGLYSLILRSNKPEARLFQRWVTNEVLPSIRRTGQYTAPAAPEEAAQRVRRLRLENDELEMRNLATVMRALTDAGEEMDDAQRWLFRDRMSNLLRGSEGAGPEQTTHASAFLVDVKGMSARDAQKLRQTFGAIAARIKRQRLGLPPNADLPSGLKDVGGHPTRVKIYRVPGELDILEEAYEELTESALYHAVFAAGRSRFRQRDA